MSESDREYECCDGLYGLHAPWCPNPSKPVHVDPAVLAAADRWLAGQRELSIARFGVNLAARDAEIWMHRFALAVEASNERLAIAEAREIAAHPDLAEFNARMDGFYERP